MLLLIPLLSLAFSQCPTGIPLVETFNPSTYFQGQWWEIQVSRYFTERLDPKLTCVNANYEFADGEVSVANCGTEENGDNFCQNAVARAQEGGVTGAFEVSFSPNVWGQYHVLRTTGSAEDGYETAIVYGCDQFGEYISSTIFVLSRSPEMSQAEIQENIDFMREIGITNDNGALDLITRMNGCNEGSNTFCIIFSIDTFSFHSLPWVCVIVTNCSCGYYMSTLEAQCIFPEFIFNTNLLYLL